MNHFFRIFLFVFWGLCVWGCKSQRHISDMPEINKANFLLVDVDSLKKWDAVVVDERIYMRIGNLIRDPWSTKNINSFSWIKTVRREILFLTNSDDADIATINYFNPRYTNMNPMPYCEMRLYHIDDRGVIRSRKLKKNEMNYKRLNDSTARVQIQVKESVAGKILVQEYTTLYPYYRISSTYSHYELAKIPEFLFQRNVPVLFAQYKILVPNKLTVHDKKTKNEIIQSGMGNIKINRSKTTAKYYSIEKVYERIAWTNSSYIWTIPSTPWRNDDKSKSIHSKEYGAEEIIMNSDDIMPLPVGSHIRPLSIEINRTQNMNNR